MLLWCKMCGMIGGYCGDCSGFHWQILNQFGKLSKEGQIALRSVKELPKAEPVFSAVDGPLIRKGEVFEGKKDVYICAFVGAEDIFCWRIPK